MILNIPNIVHVCYQNREGTVDGRLSFPVGEKDDGRRVNEDTWLRWGQRLDIYEKYDNKPQIGFTVQKNVTRQNSFGSDKFRIWHPQGYEFEISTANMIYIMKHSDISKSEITVPCVMSWNRDKLFLLPVNSEIYLNHLKLQIPKTKWTKKMGLIPGKFYEDSKKRSLMFLGNLKHYEFEKSYYGQIEFNDSVAKKCKKVNLPATQDILRGKRTIRSHTEDGNVFYCSETNQYVHVKLSGVKFVFRAEDPVGVDGDEITARLEEAAESEFFKPLKVRLEEHNLNNLEIIKNQALSYFKHLNLRDYAVYDRNKIKLGCPKDIGLPLGENDTALMYSIEFSSSCSSNFSSAKKNVYSRYNQNQEFINLLEAVFQYGTSSMTTLFYIKAIEKGLFDLQIEQSLLEPMKEDLKENFNLYKIEMLYHEDRSEDIKCVYINNTDSKLENIGFGKFIFSYETLDAIFDEYFATADLSAFYKAKANNTEWLMTKNSAKDMIKMVCSDKETLLRIATRYWNENEENLVSQISNNFYDVTVRNDGTFSQTKIDLT